MCTCMCIYIYIHTYIAALFSWMMPCWPGGSAGPDLVAEAQRSSSSARGQALAPMGVLGGPRKICNTYIYIHIHIYYKYRYIYIYVSVYVYLYTSIHRYVNICVCIYMHT